MSKNTIITDSKWFVENAIERDFLEANGKAESLGRIHKPIPHWEVLEKFRNEASSRGLELVNQQGRLHKDGMRYMFTAEIEDPSHPDYNMSVGFWNFNNRQRSFAGCLAAHILICKNGLMTGLIQPSKQRHTTGNYELVGDKVKIIFDRFASERDNTAGQIDLMKHTALTDDILGKFLLAVHRNGGVGAANTFQVLDKLEDKLLNELESPTVNDRNDNSVWRLSNAASWIATHKVRSPMLQAETSKRFHDAIMGIIDPAYRPIGSFDTIDVEAEVVQA